MIKQTQFTVISNHEEPSLKLITAAPSKIKRGSFQIKSDSFQKLLRYRLAVSKHEEVNEHNCFLHSAYLKIDDEMPRRYSCAATNYLNKEFSLL